MGGKGVNSSKSTEIIKQRTKYKSNIRKYNANCKSNIEKMQESKNNSRDRLRAGIMLPEESTREVPGTSRESRKSDRKQIEKVEQSSTRTKDQMYLHNINVFHTLGQPNADGSGKEQAPKSVKPEGKCPAHFSQLHRNHSAKEGYHFMKHYCRHSTSMDQHTYFT